MKKKVIITGSTGMLGKDIIEKLLEEKDFFVYGIDKIPNPKISEENQINGDLTDFDFLEKTIDKINPDIIIHCAAIVDVNSCEQNKEKVDALHYEATKILASFNPIKSRVVYISSDSVFDGKKGNYKEKDSPEPLNYYAKSKLKGEEVVLKQNTNSVVIRTNIYGFHIFKGNSLAEGAIENLSIGNYIKGFSDVFFNPLYTKQLARIVTKLINSKKSHGILNVACNEYSSKYSFLIRLAKAFNFSSYLINEGSIDEVEFDTLRPKNTTLNTDKLKKLIGYVPSLEEGIQMLKKDYLKSFPRGEK